MIILSPEHQWWYSWFTGNSRNWGRLRLLLCQWNVNNWFWFWQWNVNHWWWGRCRLDMSDRLGWYCRFRLRGNKLSEELSVAFSYGPGAINTDMITVMWSDLNNNTSLGPLLGIVAMLVLDKYMVTWL